MPLAAKGYEIDRVGAMLPGFVDNLTHSLLGAALAKTRLGALTPRAAPFLVLAANLPDADLVSIPLWPAFSQCWDKRRGGSGSPLRWRGALLLAAVGIGSQPALDDLNTYGWRPWLPLDDQGREED